MNDKINMIRVVTIKITSITMAVVSMISAHLITKKHRPS